MGSKLALKQGKYGRSKAKCFTVLSDGRWYTAKQLCILTGISYPSLGSALPRWERFDYVSREPILFGGRYQYQLTAKAKSWLRLAARYLPNYRLFKTELMAWQANMADAEVDELLTVPFKEFIASLDELIKEFQKNN
ncbi:unnamed protein product, partial [marine sediment metagenome]